MEERSQSEHHLVVFGVEDDEFVCFFCCEVQIFSHCSPGCLGFVGLLTKQPNSTREINKTKARFVWCLDSP